MKLSPPIKEPLSHETDFIYVTLFKSHAAASDLLNSKRDKIKGFAYSDALWVAICALDSVVDRYALSAKNDGKLLFLGGAA